jgi:hypothetical protein
MSNNSADNLRKQIADKLRDLTGCYSLIWESNPGRRNYSAEYRGVNFELDATGIPRLQVDHSIEIEDTSGMLDELIWAVEAQVNPSPGGGSSSSPKSPDEALKDLLYKLEL